jgi:UDPglucose--hexose-1-phosphate uridylyltransferase|tara:strand:- start:127 stop:1101 length:975 start_codon:yes stop_codon:yes gene_type:complete
MKLEKKKLSRDLEIRKDYILDRWVYIASDRKKRPKEYQKDTIIQAKKYCLFCPGNENLTPKEIGRIEENGKWKIRWFPNKFPVVTKQGNPKIKKINQFLTKQDSYGYHEIIAECPQHNKQLWDLNTKHITQILEVYKQRIIDLEKDKNIKYTLIFKNHGREAGASLIHSHTQLVALSKIPSTINNKLKATKKYKSCPYCKILKLEKNSKRKCFENKSFIAFTPFASRFNYELWIFPKKHITNITKLNKEQTKDLAIILKKSLKRLKKINASYNFSIHNSPNKQDLHFHIEITPRIASWGGFELGTDDIINSVLPEDAAKFYRKR